MDTSGITSLTDWFLEGPPWVVYRARRDILGQAEDDPAVAAARTETLKHPLVEALLAELLHWPGVVMKNHKDAGHPVHKLTFLANLGLNRDDPPIAKIAERIFRYRSEQGPFQILVNIHPRYGGTGMDQPAWMLCDAPLIIYALTCFGYGEDPRVQTAVEHLSGLARPDGGWPCAVCPDLGRFRGPGRKDDPCPYATLVMLKALGRLPTWRGHRASLAGAEVLLELWSQRRDRRPYLFAMGSDFAKLKAPLIWYDVLHMVEVLSEFPAIQGDHRFRELCAVVQSYSEGQVGVTPGSVWRAWKAWDFGQKREPSRWLTLLVLRLQNRIEEVRSG